MPDATDKAVSQRIHSIFPNPEVASEVVRIITATRPLGTSHRSHYPYYKKEYADEIKPFVDGMIENKQDIIYKYEVWCTEMTGINPTTLYTRIDQALRYLVDKMDTEDGKYTKWRDNTEKYRKRGVGIVITFRKGLPMSSIQPEFVQPKDNTPVWRKKLDVWLESDDTRPFVVDKLALDQDEVRQLKIELASLTSVIADITSNGINIIKVNE